ncbi:gfo/Idh/MocA family oxidoreductase [Lachnospiraceae bacterium AM48-27BH]|jgi:predicted dehydrogenase|nr:gfo/Idh/MocA family oxidoreductase [Lachnospiraceae bacterium AM48-27BH]
MVKAAIIGCGKIAQVRHIPEYLEHQAVNLVGFYDLNEKRAEELAEKYGGKAYGSVEELLADPQIDAVSICTANHTHAELTIKALKAGKHVLCEKPMAITLEECQRMVECAEENHRKLLIGQNQRLTRTHQMARKLIADGEIGNVLSFQTSFQHSGPESWSVDAGKNTWFFQKKAAAMGVMGDLGIHKTDLIQYLLDDQIVEVTAEFSTLDKCYENGEKIDVEDQALCIYQMKHGAVGTMRASWVCYGQEDNSTIIYGSDGVMKIYCDPRYSLQIEKKDGEHILYEIDKIQTNADQTSSGVITEFIRSIEEDTASVLDGKQIVNSMKGVFAAIQSNQLHIKVMV